MRIVSPKPYYTFRAELVELYAGEATFHAGETGFSVVLPDPTWRELGRPSTLDIPLWHADEDS